MTLFQGVSIVFGIYVIALLGQLTALFLFFGWIYPNLKRRGSKSATAGDASEARRPLSRSDVPPVGNTGGTHIRSVTRG